MLLQNAPVVTKLMAVDDAIASGARALFGEKYGDEVRVVSMGLPVDGDAAQPRAKNFSVELCGGTHAARTGDIGAITIVAESAVGAGVRRIEALTADAARRHRAEEARTLAALAGILRAPVAEAPDRLTALMEDRRRLERELAETRRKLAMGGEGGPGTGAQQTEIGGVAFRRSIIEGLDMRDLKPIVDEEKKRLGSGIVAVVGVGPDGKAGLVVGVTDDLTGRYDAVGLVRAGAAALGGEGRRRSPRHGAGRRAERGRGRGRPRRRRPGPHRGRLRRTETGLAALFPVRPQYPPRDLCGRPGRTSRPFRPRAGVSSPLRGPAPLGSPRITPARSWAEITDCRRRLRHRPAARPATAGSRCPPPPSCWRSCQRGRPVGE